MDIKLKPCPFCGASARIWKWNGGVRVDCSNWKCVDPNAHFIGIGARTETEAIAAWNRRAEE